MFYGCSGNQNRFRERRHCETFCIDPDYPAGTHHERHTPQPVHESLPGSSSASLACRLLYSHIIPNHCYEIEMYE